MAMKLALNDDNKLVIPCPRINPSVAMLISLNPSFFLTKDISHSAYLFGKKEGYVKASLIYKKTIDGTKERRNYEIKQMQTELESIHQLIYQHEDKLNKNQASLSMLIGGLLYINIKSLKCNKSYDVLENFRLLGQKEGYLDATMLYEEKLSNITKEYSQEIGLNLQLIHESNELLEGYKKMIKKLEI